MHKCDETCICPVDGKPLLYSPRYNQHACQDPECKNAHGVSDEPMTEKERDAMLHLTVSQHCEKMFDDLHSIAVEQGIPMYEMRSAIESALGREMGDEFHNFTRPWRRP